MHMAVAFSVFTHTFAPCCKRNFKQCHFPSTDMNCKRNKELLDFYIYSIEDLDFFSLDDELVFLQTELVSRTYI